MHSFTLSSRHVLFCCTDVDGQNGSSSELVTTVPGSHQSQTGSYVVACIYGDVGNELSLFSGLMLC